MMKSKLLGSTLIIAGTTIGAGMLALPLASAGIGFSTSLMIMFALWAMMAFTALLMVEIHQYADKDATLHTLAKQILGRKGKWVATFAMLFLFYALCAAYIAGGGAQFTSRIGELTGLEVSGPTGTLIFTLIVAAVVTIGTGTVDRVNRLLFAGKMVAMVMVLTFLAPNVSQSYLLSMPLGQGLVIASIPVIFTSFGFHGSIPAIVNYLDGHTPSLRKAIVIGSAIPLIIYVFWQIVTLGVVSQPQLVENAGLSALIGTLSQTVHQSNLGNVIGIFADLALLTSFLGVSLGLFEFMGDTIRKKDGNMNRMVASLATFVPPLMFALFYPQGFIMALGYAAIALAVLAIFLPLMMVSRVRRQSKEGTYYQVMGGTPALAITGVVGILIVGAQLLITIGVLPSLG
ncbi:MULTISPECIES: aromatic amino acid transport family protein [Vibrio]|uniref:aromatic amino acid transport family protein n=1 Tax=Vibrio TaxID=662 RepID=UPI00117F6B28|nr:aromatic amino acid transport family protein [Vibrio furnissii]MCG6214053.1 aromatic amino acid transporter [Vibrio furnissii]MCG6217278.1 aromatic amino acid transporter [Vibrio furnissii]MCG6234616.1 aromatic amino acid transporter [Vibrio furnissii]MCG6257875.1 aromatic amino acid transporter [Vibrio furnissii]MCG6267408.1 aromatic amino acid transporter [Vibrio furnissii]